MKGSLRLTIITVILCMVIGLTGCSLNKISKVTGTSPNIKELLMNVPEMDVSAYNRFLFNMDIIAGNKDGDDEEISINGAVEIRENISHMYNLDISITNSGYKTTAETWADFDANKRYTNLGDGFVIDKITNAHAITDMMDAINNRNTEMIVTEDTISWIFPIDNKYIFGAVMEHYTKDMNLNGYGRITAVLDKETHKFQYFTFVISTSNEEHAGAMLDAVFYWDVVNGSELLKIPDEIFQNAYKSSTGVMTEGGYDDKVNPMAESFMEAYKGTAKVTCYENGAAMFWTKEENGTSAVVNYTRTSNPTSLYDEHYEFLKSFYGAAAEETDNEAYFYVSSAGELTYMAKGDDWYAEIIITGKPEATQGELRKSLITYKSRLGI